MGSNWEPITKKGASTYRFGFNGMENDHELKGDGNSLDFGARIYDPRIGRWLSVDPLQVKFPSYSPYHAYACNPLLYVDKDGKDNIVYIVFLPSSDATLTFQDKAKIIKKMNNTFKRMGVSTKVKGIIIDPNSIVINASSHNITYMTTDVFNTAKPDKNDGFVIVGEGSKVSEFITKSGHFSSNFLKEENGYWTGDYDNPETTSKGDQKVSALDAEDANTNVVKNKSGWDKTEAVAFFALHGTGHQAHKDRIGDDEHSRVPFKPNGKAFYPSIMNEGEVGNNLMPKNSFLDFTKYYKGNKEFANNMKKTFGKEKGGTQNTPVDNFVKSIQ